MHTITIRYSKSVYGLLQSRGIYNKRKEKTTIRETKKVRPLSNETRRNVFVGMVKDGILRTGSGVQVVGLLRKVGKTFRVTEVHGRSKDEEGNKLRKTKIGRRDPIPVSCHNLKDD